MALIEIFPSSADMTRAAANLFAARAAEAVSAQGRFTAALSGGKTPVALYDLLAKDPFASQIPWARVHLFWGDERCVPPDHGDSNYRLVRERLINHVPIPPANVHRMPGEMDPVEAAARYEEQLREFFAPHGGGFPVFDLILLGLGEDGHTASLFPGTRALRESARWVLGHYVGPRKGWRITLTPPTINAARLVVFIAAGTEKALVLRDILEGPFRPDTLPAQMVRPAGGDLKWMLDREAAAQLKGEKAQKP
ncbi:MAG TPA: 6-phosphogluconolactonase [Syntrophales bacterium]